MTQSLRFRACFLFRGLSWCTIGTRQNTRQTELDQPKSARRGSLFAYRKAKLLRKLKTKENRQAFQLTTYIWRTACFKPMVARMPSDCISIMYGTINHSGPLFASNKNLKWSNLYYRRQHKINKDIFKIP